MRLIYVSAISVALFGTTAMAADAAAGKAVYDKSCKMCHGAEGQGNPGMAKMLKVTFRPLGSKEVQASKDEDLKKVVTQGTGKMKPVAGLNDKQVADVIAHIRTLKQ
jgi:mono/diheme cytochrome c family protein